MGGSNCGGLGQASRVVGRRKDGSRSVPHLLALVYEVTPGAQHRHGEISGEGRYPVYLGHLWLAGVLLIAGRKELQSESALGLLLPEPKGTLHCRSFQ